MTMTPAYAPPPPMDDGPIELTKANVTELLTSGKVVVIDLWATWCSPCKLFMPIYEQAARAIGSDDRVVFTKCDIDEQPWIAQQLSVKSVPTLIIAKGGQILRRESRGVPLTELVQMVGSVLDDPAA